MFNKKQSAKPVVKKAPSLTQKVGANPFLVAAQTKSLETTSGNGALKYTSTGNELVDQMGKLGQWKQPRAFTEIVKDFESLWADNPLNAVKFSLFLRTIPRKVNLPDGTVTEEPQKGAELKHEPIMRMIYLAVKHPQAFWNNLPLFVSLGSWHDVFTMLQYDLVYNGWNDRKLDWQKFGQVIMAALGNKHTCELVKKYLPQIKSNSSCVTVEAQANNSIAKWLCSIIFGAKEGSHVHYKSYRHLKTSGTAHQWQQLISKKKFDELDFGKIHGRALSILVRGKFLKNHNLSTKYAQWVTKPETKVKYTGFVHELFEPLKQFTDGHVRVTIDKQFETLVEKAKSKEGDITRLIVVRDTSSSMGSTATGTKSSCFNIGKALALYFSEFLQGQFANSWIEFNSDAKLHTWKGNTPTEKWLNDRSGFIGGTDFQRVIKLFCDIKSRGVDEKDFPKGILCISDSEFNPGQLGKTNVQTAKDNLTRGGFSKEYVDNFVIVLWNLQSSYYGAGTGSKFETVGEVPNVHYFSGFSPSIISFLNNDKPTTAKDTAESALDQQVLNMVSLDAPVEEKKVHKMMPENSTNPVERKKAVLLKEKLSSRKKPIHKSTVKKVVKAVRAKAAKTVAKKKVKKKS